MSEPREDAYRMTGAMFVALSQHPGMTVTIPEPDSGMGATLIARFDVLPGTYLITVEPMER